MNYLDRLSNSPKHTITPPAKPAKPPMGSVSVGFAGNVGFAGRGNAENAQNPDSSFAGNVGFAGRGNAENYQGASPIWVIAFPDGRHYQTEFDPPITMVALLEKWAARHPNQPITTTLPIPAELWAAMELAAGRFDWCAETWAVQIGICLLYTSPSPRDRTRSRMPSSA